MRFDQVTKAIIRFDRVSKVFPEGTKAVNDVSFEIDEGECVTFVGPSGCSKTTTAKLLNRLGFEAILEVGPSGNFLSSMHTVKFMRQEYFRQTLADRQTREAWEKSGALDGRTRDRRKAKEILQTHSPKGIDLKIDQEIRKRFDILI